MKTHPLKNSSPFNVPLTGPEKKVIGFLLFLSLLGLIALAVRSLWSSTDGPLWVQPALKESLRPSPVPAYQAFAAKTVPALASVNLNEAGVNDLKKVPHVGLVTAQRILQFRQKKGSFSDVSQLQEVPGIGEKRCRQIAPYFYVSSGPWVKRN